jgi:peptide/nickel transport system permease protein
MPAFILRRLAQLIPVIFVMLAINFALIHLAPGDPTLYIIGDAPASEELMKEVRGRLGLDQPLPIQFLTYIGNVLQGDLGYSFASRASVASVILERLPATLLLMGSQYILAIFVGVALGMISARWPYGLIDQGVTALSVIGFAVPPFWIGQMAILLLAVTLGWFPTSGMMTIGYDMTFAERAADVAAHLVLPMVTLALGNVGLIARITRANLIQNMKLEYIVYARSKGLSEGSILFRHALRNAVLPVITVIGLNVRTLIAGAVLTETVFSWPGLGRLTYEAIYARDYPVLMGMLIFIGILVILANLITDIAQAMLDPRIRLS